MTDQEIRDALRVDPSPEFLARVRTRIAGEPAPSAWRWSWTVAAVGALAAMVLIAVVFSWPEQRNASAPDVAHAFEPAGFPAGPEGPALQPTPPTRSAAARRPGPSTAAQATPVLSGFSRTMSGGAEVLLDPAETRALRRLIAGVRDGHVDLSMMRTSTTPVAMELEPVADIVIAPITIEPIAPLSGAEGVRP